MADLRGSGRLIIVAFDPGETTGYVRLALSKRLLLKNGTTAALQEATRNGRWRHSQFGLRGDGPAMGEEGAALQMAMLTRLAWVEEVRDEAVDSFVVVIEDFLLFRSERSRSLLSPVRLTARYQQEMRTSGLTVVTNQTSADAKRIVTDARLRRWHVYDDEDGGGLGRHCRDAMRHAILFARKWASRPDVRAHIGTGRKVVDHV